MQTEISTEPKINCVIGLSFKEYYLSNEKFREKTKARWRKHYEENKKPKYTCDCGCEISLGSKLKHEQSKKHLELLINKKIEMKDNIEIEI